MRTALLLAATALLAAGCSADTGEESASESAAVFCRACVYVPPPPPINRDLPPVCGVGGTLDRTIALFTAGNVDATPSAIEHDPIHYRVQIQSYDPAGSTIPVAFDGQTMNLTMGTDTIARGAFDSPAPFSPTSTPLTHSLSVSSACGTHTQSITLTPVTEAQVFVPYARISASNNAVVPGQSVTLTWDVGDTNVRIYDCALTSLGLGWRPLYGPGSGGPFQGIVAILNTGSKVVGPINQGVVYSIIETCAAHPLFTNDPTASTNISLAAPPSPVIKSWNVSSTQVNQNSPITISWDVDFAWCGQSELIVTGDSEDRVGTRVLQEAVASKSGPGSVEVDVGEWTRYSLTAWCKDTNASVKSSSIDVHVFPPSNSNVSYFCFKAQCTYAGCTTQSVPTTNEAAAQAALAQIYPSSSGCTTSQIDCSQLATACPDPFGS